MSLSLFQLNKFPGVLSIGTILFVLFIIASEVDYSLDNEAGLEKSPVGSRQFPIIYAGEYMDGAIPSIQSDGPVFSSTRKVVNPALPRIVTLEGRERTYFDIPGEYYLQSAEDTKMRALVLDPSNEISENILRTFDFLVANLISSQGHSSKFISNRQEFLAEYFLTHEPVMLLCGETLSLFSMIIKQRFSLPVRPVTFTGVWLDGGMVKYSTHNVLEVYLPDKEKWMLFDLNNGFAAKWMDAFDLADAVRKAASSQTKITSEEFSSIKFNVHYEVDAKRPKSAADSRSEFTPEMLTNTSTRDEWFGFGRVLFSGPGYWGGKRSGESKLPKNHDLYLSRYHDDEFLLEAQLRWQGNWDLDTVHVAPRRLKAMLNDAYQEEIAEKAWLAKIPNS